MAPTVNCICESDNQTSNQASRVITVSYRPQISLPECEKTQCKCLSPGCDQLVHATCHVRGGVTRSRGGCDVSGPHDARPHTAAAPHHHRPPVRSSLGVRIQNQTQASPSHCHQPLATPPPLLQHQQTKSTVRSAGLWANYWTGIKIKMV